MIHARSLFPLLLIVGFDLGSAFRMTRTRKQRTETRTALAVGMEAQAGHVLGGRFVLERFVESRSSSKQPGKTFPDIEGFSDPEHLGQGTFGDVWEAYDEQLKKRVAVKIFYWKSGGQKKWLTWNSANAKQIENLEESIEECVLVQNMLKQSSLYPEGASRICACYEEHVSKYQGTDELTFLVLELCGRSLEDISKDLKRLDDSTRIAKSRELTKQLLEAIAFMNMLDPPLIHHDLKPANAVALEGSGFSVKLIDFGCFVWGTPENQNSRSRGHKIYIAPEFSGRVAFKMPAYSFDIYSVGVMHALFSCPRMTIRTWSNAYPSWKGENCAGLPDSDMKLIQALTDSDNTQRPAPLVALEEEMFSGGSASSSFLVTSQSTRFIDSQKLTQILNLGVGLITSIVTAFSEDPIDYEYAADSFQIQGWKFVKLFVPEQDHSSEGMRRAKQAWDQAFGSAAELAEKVEKAVKSGEIAAIIDAVATTIDVALRTCSKAMPKDALYFDSTADLVNELTSAWVDFSIKMGWMSSGASLAQVDSAFIAPEKLNGLLTTGVGIATAMISAFTETPPDFEYAFDSVQLQGWKMVKLIVPEEDHKSEGMKRAKKAWDQAFAGATDIAEEIYKAVEGGDVNAIIQSALKTVDSALRTAGEVWVEDKVSLDGVADLVQDMSGSVLKFSKALGWM